MDWFGLGLLVVKIILMDYVVMNLWLEWIDWIYYDLSDFGLLIEV